jgi:hypothetical protein
MEKKAATKSRGGANVSQLFVPSTTECGDQAARRHSLEMAAHVISAALIFYITQLVFPGTKGFLNIPCLKMVKASETLGVLQSTKNASWSAVSLVTR